MNIETLVAEVERALNAYKQGDYDYRPRFDSDVPRGEALATQFAELADKMRQDVETVSLVDGDDEYQALFEQTKEMLVETKALHLAAQSLRAFQNLPKMLEKIVDNVATVIPADTALLVLVKDQTISHMVAGGSGGMAHTQISPDEFFQGLGGWVLREKKPALSPKGKVDRRESRQIQHARTAGGIGSVMVVPIATQTEVLGALFAMNRMEQRDFTERDMKVLMMMANSTANAIASADLYRQSQQEIRQRKKFEKALLKERDLLQALMDNVPDYIYFKDSRLHYVRSNTAHATELLKVSEPRQVIGKTDFDFFAKDVAQKIYDDEQRIINTGKAVTGHKVEIRTGDDKVRWLLEHKLPRKNSRGRVIGLVGISRDITHLKRIEETLARRATELETVMQVGTDISRILNTDELLQNVVDLTKSAFELYHAHVYVLDGKVLHLAAGSGNVGQQMVSEGWRIPLEREQSLVARTARAAEPIVVNDVRQSADYFQNPLLPDTRAELAVPLLVGDDVLGVLDVQADETDYFTDDDIRVYSALGAQVAVALQNARSFSRAQATLTETEALYKISRALNTVAELPDLLKAVTEMVTDSISATWATLVTVDMAAKRLEASAASGPDADELLPPSFEVLMDGVGGWTLEQQQAALSPKGEPDSRETLDVQQRRLRLGVGAMVSVPLVYRDKPLGVLSALNPMHGRDFARQDVNLLVAIGNQVAAAIENRNLLAQTQKRAEREEAIRQVTEKLRAAPNLDMLLQTAAEELGVRLGAKHSVLELGVTVSPAVTESE